MNYINAVSQAVLIDKEEKAHPLIEIPVKTLQFNEMRKH